MILNFKQAKLYVCQFVNSKGGISSFKFVPGDNKIPNAEAKFLLKHPGIKNRLDLGILVEKQSVTEDLVKEAANKAKADAKALAEVQAKAKADAEAKAKAETKKSGK